MLLSRYSRPCLLLQVVATLTLFLLFGILPLHALSSSSSFSKILVVGASGGTGQRALQGLLDVGYAPEQIQILTRNVNNNKPALVALRDNLGFGICQADLDDSDNMAALVEAMTGCDGCYIHSTSSDTKKLDTGEVDRAQNLVKAILATKHNTIRHIVYNSAAAEPEHGVERIQQKHNVEQVFLNNKEFARKNITFTSLRANLFMEELWKSYTRPSILKGTFPFSVPSDRPIYLTSVRDMGRLAGSYLQSPAHTSTTQNRILNVAGDVLTAKEMADAFGKAQGTHCRHSQSRFFAFLSRLFFKDLYQVIRFYQKSTETTDIPALKKEFPGLLTSFETFLEETSWADPNLSFDDLKIAAAPIQQESSHQA